MSTAIITEEWTTHAPSPSPIYHRIWSPPSSTPLRATVAFCHGMGEHVGRYDHVFNKFAVAGIKVRGFDQRGFGQTVVHKDVVKEATLGHNEGWERLMEDVGVCVERSRESGVKGFLMGHSMGGGIALSFAMGKGSEKGLAGVVVSSPLIALGPNSAVSTPEYWAIRGLSKILPTLTIKSTVDDANLSHLPSVRESYRADPLVHAYTSFGTAASCVLNGEKLAKTAGSFSLPVLVVCGDEDKIVSFKAAEQWAEKCGSSDKEWKVVKGGLHELHNDTEQDAIIQHYIDWILKRA
ncbi:Alpha/Beta hydrolase protein [Fimicolochytrium jonesii]|uniref:Alpha/Beta hydrolase protein n=1 Tax=Fimicolochytrium jonesii TaxID=1396493 RepID=UPI0022FE5292|nr:Alpha/Beta hydrolase protein [Fimicolochytrium jonesii]KAI8826237.1 Alpha/Beta hydrolase protein [Fimicolochytrium jonesii]